LEGFDKSLSGVDVEWLQATHEQEFDQQIDVAGDGRALMLR